MRNVLLLSGSIMDIPGVNDGWELEVNPLMQEMQAHREDEYFNPQE
ncbi:hypothetical protein pipiens_012775, partial [Culex pipiens pipiens]